ncbi:ribokinase [Paenibacillus filicis]|uniref:Ribokinase n=1 Tax=Paenibacillus gyeongsangnamensis TaxID=3388067 RepID=A0ABT4Q211_9BACL|nr:ribokinase [Paenibacillus filicis]MCZ8510920.1 ribokinase [Paenibacillus filicis]
MNAPNITVIGSLNMDIVVESDRFPVQGETLLGKAIRFLPGGKGANQAVASARLGASTRMIGAVGDDSFGRELLQALTNEGIVCEGVRAFPDATTGIANIFVSQGDNSIIVLSGANHLLNPEDIDRIKLAIEQADIVLLQLEIPLETVSHAAKLAKSFGKTVVLNPAPAQPLPESLLRDVDYITPNRTELSLLTGFSENDDLEASMRKLIGMGARHVITTLGSEGSAFIEASGPLVKVPGYKVPVVDTTGAGDSFNAALAYSLAQRKSLEESVSFAAKVSALAVTKFGAQPGMPTLEEVEQFTTRMR